MGLYKSPEFAAEIERLIESELMNKWQYGKAGGIGRIVEILRENTTDAHETPATETVVGPEGVEVELVNVDTVPRTEHPFRKD